MTYVNTGSVTAIGIIFPLLTCVSLALRIYGWHRYPRKAEVDDALIIPAAFLTVAAGVAIIVGAQMHIIGDHSLPAITVKEEVNLGKFEYAFWICHILAICFIKLSLLFLFRRIFKGRTSRTVFDYANWILIALVISWTLAFLFADIFACGKTPAASWSSLYSLRHACVDTFGLQTGCAVFSWALDLAILIEPLLMIRSLNMGSRRKMQASVVFLCSTFAVIAGLLRMVIWIQIETQGTLTQLYMMVLGTYSATADQEGIVSIILFWTYVEIGIGFIVACIPPSAGLIDQLLLTPIMINIRSFPSLIFTAKRIGRSQSRNIEVLQEPQALWLPTIRQKKPPNRSWRADSEAELVTISVSVEQTIV